MPLNAEALAEAKRLVALAGMGGFPVASQSPASTGGQSIPLALIDSTARGPGVPIFDKVDEGRPGVVRSASILRAVRDGSPLPPVLLFQPVGETRYELRDGFHRLHLFAALGFTHVFAEVTDWKPESF